MRLRCIECGRDLDDLPASCECPCGGLLEVSVDDPRLPPDWQQRPLSAWRYRELLPLAPGADPVRLAEGGTPLVEAPGLADELGLGRLAFKVEGANPTGSFKDRGMTCAVTDAVHRGADVLGCASTGNTAASMAAYAARAGVEALVLVPQGQVAAGKLAQARAHGASVLAVEGDFDDAMSLIVELAESGDVALLNSKNPLRLAGQRTLMYEVLDQHPGVPDRVVYPVGNAGNISAAHRALLDYDAAGLLVEMPGLTGVQVQAAAPIAEAIRTDAADVEPVQAGDTVASAIRIGDPVSAPKALAAIRGTDGTAVAVPDEEVVQAQRDLARRLGVFAEPASCASLAGLRALADEGALDAGEEVVCVLTGHGLKDPDAADRLAGPPREVPATRRAVREALGWG